MGEACFQIYKDAVGMFRFRLIAPNGEIIAASEGFESKSELLRRIELLKKHAFKAATVMEAT